MSKKSGWRDAQNRRTIGVIYAPVKAEPTAFEQYLAQIGVSESEAARSKRVREWVERHRGNRYVPERLLEELKMREW